MSRPFRSRPRLYVRYEGREVALDTSEIDWLQQELVSGRHAAADADAALIVTRIRHASETTRSRRLALSRFEAATVLAVLDRGENRGELTHRLHTLQLAMRMADR